MALGQWFEHLLNYINVCRHNRGRAFMTRADLTQNTLFVLALCVFGGSAPALSQTSTFFERGLGEISPAPSGRHQSAIERGEAEMSHRDFEGAISAFSEAIGFNMNNADAYFKRGQCYYYQKNYASALSDFEYMLKMNPHDTQALLWTGTVQARLGHEEKAVDLYLKALRNNPQLVTQFQQGNGQKSQAVNPKNEGAVSAYEKAVQLYLADGKSSTTTAAGSTVVSTDADSVPTSKLDGSPSDKDDNSRKDKSDNSRKSKAGNSRKDKSDISPTGIGKNFDPADGEIRIEQIDAAIKADPTNAILLFRRGTVNRRLGKMDNALLDFTEAIRLDPMKPRFYLARARLYHDQNQTDLSQADIKKAQSVDPSISRHLKFSDVNDY